MSAIGAVSAHAAPVRVTTRGVALVGRWDVAVRRAKAIGK